MIRVSDVNCKHCFASPLSNYAFLVILKFSMRMLAPGSSEGRSLPIKLFDMLAIMVMYPSLSMRSTCAIFWSDVELFLQAVPYVMRTLPSKTIVD